MVAFMSTLPVDDEGSAWVVKRRWLISMCANELLITIATCKRPYFEFLAMKRGSRGDMTELREDNFLHMKEHGPYQLPTCVASYSDSRRPISIVSASANYSP